MLGAVTLALAVEQQQPHFLVRTAAVAFALAAAAAAVVVAVPYETPSGYTYPPA